MNNISDDVLAKYLLGETTAEENNRVEEWLKQKEENKKYYEHFSLIWKVSRDLSAVSAINEDEAWKRFKERTVQSSKPASKPFNWLKVAAVCLLLAGGSWLSYITIKHKEQPISGSEKLKVNTLIKKNDDAPIENKMQTDNALEVRESINNSEKRIEKEIADNSKHQAVKRIKSGRKVLVANSSTNARKDNNMKGLYSYYKKKEVVCNGTACPIEICIIQSAKCKNKEASTISTCNTLEPDESGQLHYKTYDKTLANCILSIEEIRITRLSTGETIVLNDSTPVKAQDLFNYMTGRKKGDIVAGIFHTDCNNHSHSHDLTFDNKLGDLLLK